ncbi:hypothetical protein GGR53DRAFT_532951 [Hypoxylon sp. FL1150]|nr:hypothetical protein GGR53DRAFT_532951 [Hypoxylon sp. FL1150]
MEAIKRLLRPDRREKRRKDCMANQKYSISPPIENRPGTQVPTRVPTLEFTPRDQAHDASVAFLENHTSEDLTRLLNERDRAESLVGRGPKTNGTSEVQSVLSEPSIRSVARLHDACKQAEMSLKYGTSGRLVYNFSKSIAWNKTRAPRLPSLQFTSFGDNAFHSSKPPISRTSPPVSEAGEDLSGPSHEEAECNIRDSILEMLDETEWELQEAKVLTVLQVPTSKVRKVQISHGCQSPALD